MLLYASSEISSNLLGAASKVFRHWSQKTITYHCLSYDYFQSDRSLGWPISESEREIGTIAPTAKTE